MCRWIAYSGGPIHLEDLIFEPEHSLIDQSLEARSAESTTNGDGFGVGWYGSRDFPGVYRDIRPAWNDRNLRDLALAVDPELYAMIDGSTDSEIMFYLSLTFGLEEDPIGGVERMVAFVEEHAREIGVENGVQMTLGLVDGERIYAFRYSTEGRSRTLFHSERVEALQHLNPAIERFSPDARAIVSEPLTHLTDYWVEIPESTVAIVEAGEVSFRAFEPGGTA